MDRLPIGYHALIVAMLTKRGVDGAFWILGVRQGDECRT